jgi:hypothetical protein
MNPKTPFMKTVSLAAILVASVILTVPISANDFDNQHWAALTPPDAGLSQFVNALVVYNGDLIAAGGFVTAGKDTVNSIARWDGKRWRPLGTGVDGPVMCLTVYKGELIAGGEFRKAGGSAANCIARWNGTDWKPLGFGVRGSGKSDWVHIAAMVEYDGDLVVGGRFSYAGNVQIQSMARWDGSTWREVPYEYAGDIRSFAVYDQALIAAGDISEPSSGSVVLRFDGKETWSTLGTGAPDDEVDALLTTPTGLVAGGKFTKIGGISAIGIASWNGSEWQPLGSGLGQNVWSLAENNGQVVAGGANGAIGTWNGTSWDSFGTGTSGDINAMTIFNGKLIVGGAFRRAGQARANHIAVWDQTSGLAADEGK